MAATTKQEDQAAAEQNRNVLLTPLWDSYEFNNSEAVNAALQKDFFQGKGKLTQTWFEHNDFHTSMPSDGKIARHHARVISGLWVWIIPNTTVPDMALKHYLMWNSRFEFQLEGGETQNLGPCGFYMPGDVEQVGYGDSSLAQLVTRNTPDSVIPFTKDLVLLPGMTVRVGLRHLGATGVTPASSCQTTMILRFIERISSRLENSAS